MFNFKYLVGGAALVLATSALAGGPDVAPEPASHSGFYINGQGGASILSNSDPYYSPGWNFAAALGYRWDNIRVELEGQYTRHTLNAGHYMNPVFFTFNGGGAAPGFSRLRTLNFFANGYYDFDFGSNFIPYVGLGLGWENVWANLNLVNNATPLFNRVWSLDNNSVAVQGILGLDFKVSDAVRIGLSYHAVLAVTPNFRTIENNGIVNARVFPRGNRLDNQINLGVTLFF